MTLVAAVPVIVRRVFGVPALTRVSTGLSGAAVKVYPDICAALITAPRPAAACLQTVLADGKAKSNGHQNSAEPTELPAIGGIPTKQTDLHSARGSHV